MSFTLTAANTVFLLSVASLFPVPQQLQGFSADDVTDIDPVEPAEVVIGVDGIMSFGYVPTVKKQMITLQPDSASNQLFDAWAMAQEAAQDLYVATGAIRLPGISASYALVRGILSTYRPLPPVRRILQPRQFGITWQSVTVAPL